MEQEFDKQESESLEHTIKTVEYMGSEYMGVSGREYMSGRGSEYMSSSEYMSGSEYMGVNGGSNAVNEYMASGGGSEYMSAPAALNSQQKEAERGIAMLRSVEGIMRELVSLPMPQESSQPKPRALSDMMGFSEM